MVDIYVIRCFRCDKFFRIRKVLEIYFSKKYFGNEFLEYITFLFGDK